MPPWQASRRAAVIPRSSLKHTWRHFPFPTQSTNTAIIKSFEQVWRFFYERPLPYDAVRPDRRRMRDLDMAIRQRSNGRWHDDQHLKHHLFGMHRHCRRLLRRQRIDLWWRQPSKEDAENDDAADTPDGTDTDTADAEGSEDDTDDDVETDVATTDADASPTTNRQ